jgi:hypothetical protein
MQRSVTRFLTTHQGSLARPRELMKLLVQRQAGQESTWQSSIRASRVR